MFEGEPSRRGSPFEPSGAPPLPAGSEGGGSLPLSGDGSGFNLLAVGAAFALLGLLTLALGAFAQLAAHQPLAALLLGISLGALLVAVVALLAWWRGKYMRSAP
jgi:hypothetical protein